MIFNQVDHHATTCDGWAACVCIRQNTVRRPACLSCVTAWSSWFIAQPATLLLKHASTAAGAICCLGATEQAVVARVLHNKTRWFLDNGGARVSERSWPTALTGPRTWVAWVETGLCQWGRFTTVDARCMTVAICDDSCWLQLRQYCCNSIYDNYIMHNALHFLSGFSTWNVCTRIVAHHFPSTFELSESDNWDNGNNIHMYCD